MDLKLIRLNFMEVFLNLRYSIFALISFIIISSIFNYFTNEDLIFGNLGLIYLYAELILMYLIAFLFSVFLTITIYKINYFRRFESGSGVVGGFGSLIGILVVGCPACSITLASYIGLASILSFLPWYGLELKIIAIPMLSYAICSTLKDLTVCKIKSKKKK